MIHQKILIIVGLSFKQMLPEGLPMIDGLLAKQYWPMLQTDFTTISLAYHMNLQCLSFRCSLNASA